MATLADILSIPTEITHTYEGVEKVYKLGKPGLLVQGKYQRWLEQNAREAVERGKYASDEDRDRAMNAVTRDVAAGYYQWEGPACNESMSHRAGVEKYIEIMCEVPAKEAKDVIDARWGMIVEVVRAARANDPKALRAALIKLGLPADLLKKKIALLFGSARRGKSQKRKSRR